MPRPTSPRRGGGAPAQPARAPRQGTLPFAAAGARPSASSKKAPAGARSNKKEHPPPGRTDLGRGSHLLFLPGHFPAPSADALLSALRSQVAWEQRDVTVWGRTVPQKRLVAYQACGVALTRPYSYSGLTLHPAPFSPSVLAVKSAVEAAAGCAFDTVLLNLYRDGSDCMGWHADGEPLYGPPPATIASASFGPARAYQLRPAPGEGTPHRLLEYALGHGDLLVMGGHCQAQWQHCVPARAGVAGVRVNLTFRATAGSKAAQGGGAAGTG